jgi:hypothetical protein
MYYHAFNRVVRPHDAQFKINQNLFSNPTTTLNPASNLENSYQHNPHVLNSLLRQNVAHEMPSFTAHNRPNDLKSTKIYASNNQTINEISQNSNFHEVFQLDNKHPTNNRGNAGKPVVGFRERPSGPGTATSGSESCRRVYGTMVAVTSIISSHAFTTRCASRPPQRRGSRTSCGRWMTWCGASESASCLRLGRGGRITRRPEVVSPQPEEMTHDRRTRVDERPAA